MGVSEPLTRAWQLVTVRSIGATVLSGIAAVAGSFAVAGLSESFAFTPVSSFVVFNTPDQIITFMRNRVGDMAMDINIAFTVAVTIALFSATVALALGVTRLSRRVAPTLGRRPGIRAVAGGVSVWALTMALTGAPVSALGAALPVTGVIGVTYWNTGPQGPENDDLSLKSQSRWPDSDRRRILQTTAGVAGFAGAGYLAGNYQTSTADLPALDDGAATERTQELLAEADEKQFDLPESPSLVSEVGSFYTIDINTVAPRIDREEWTLDVTGAVDSELTITYDELREMESVSRFSTLRCVGEDLNERKMDNAVWTGVPASELVEQVGATGEYTVMHADDGFFNVIPTSAFEESYIVYGMNGTVLPREHGHPVRVIVPGRWGETNVKWLTEVEFVDEDVDGYWEERGWEGTGVVSAVTKLWTVDQREDSLLLGGHAYDGTDGVAAVEVSTDGGETWTDAELSDQLSTGDAWRQWRYEFAPDPGEYEVVVRMRDENGELQEREQTDDFPDGATGWVSQTVTVE